MRTVSSTDARNGLKSPPDGVTRDADDAVVMSIDYYNSLAEMVHLLKSPANAAHLSASMEQFRTGKVVERDTVAEQP